MKRKGQIVIFENVLIFTMSVAIFIMCYAVFTVYQQSYFIPSGTADQLGEVRDYVTSYIVAFSGKEGNSSVLFKIPRYAGTEEYVVRLSNTEGLNVTTATYYKSSNLYGLRESFDLSGSAVSTRGKITLKKEGNKIKIE